MKKRLVLLAAILGIGLVLMSFTSNTYVKDSTKSECSRIGADNAWKCIKDNVPYCDGNGTCQGTGFVWVNTDSYQVAFSYTKGGTKYDLSESSEKQGYNMRFWDSGYHYVSIYFPDAVFRN